jgi:hypothetical protein
MELVRLWNVCGEMGNAHKGLVERPQGTRLLGRPTHRWIALECIVQKGCEGVNWSRLAQDTHQ